MRIDGCSICWLEEIKFVEIGSFRDWRQNVLTSYHWIDDIYAGEMQEMAFESAIFWKKNRREANG